VDVVYPSENRALARAIEGHGALVSQFAPGTPALAGHFPARNRTLAGLALGLVVVEAASRSGALISAGFAGDLGREVFAVPGRITSDTSAGANRLIQDGAKLITCWQDIVSELPEPWRRAVRSTGADERAPARPDMESDEGRMLKLLTPDEPQHIEQLIVRAGLDPGRAAATLVALELGGWARQLSGQRWVSITAGARRA
jgi:DNA processing protein